MCDRESLSITTKGLLAGVEYAYDVWVGQASGEPGLRHDPFAHAVLFREVRAGEA